MDGFFSRAEMTVRPPQSRIPRCDHCGLCYDRSLRHPKIPPGGRGRRRVLLVGERPGWEEDRDGEHFVGKTGKFLAARLARFGVDMRRDCWLYNALICYAPNPDFSGGNVADCRPNLLKVVADLKPDVVVLMGRPALWSLIGHLWRDDIGAVIRWIGKRIPSQALNAWVCPTHNPAFILREQDKPGGGDPVPGVEFDRHLEAAFALDGPPWPDGPPDYPSRVECVTDPDEAADRLARYTGGRVTFDFETTTLKPDGGRAEVVCASVCWEGEETIAFPWVGAARGAMIDMLEDPGVEKAGWNIKFEHRWCLRKLGIRVRNWVWCGMMAAHAIDPKKGGTGLKFNAMTWLGQPLYNEAIEPMLESVEPGGNEVNRVREIDLPRLLLYCGMDSLQEYEVTERQMKLLGVDSGFV